MIVRPTDARTSHPPLGSPRDPDFIIIGAMKAGTTTLYECLRQHPDVMMSDPKEPNYFSINEVYDRGRGWYRSLFSDAAEHQLCGEASASYTRLPRFPEAAQRIAQDLPNVKLIYILRNPVERFYSNYVFDTSYGGPKSLREVLLNRPYVLETSRYIEQIRNYLQFFPPAQLHCLLLEDLETDADSTIARLTNFLGLPDFSEGVRPERTFQRGKPQAERMGNRLLAAARSAPGASLMTGLLPRRARQALRDALRKSVPESSLATWVIKRKIAQCEPLTEALRREVCNELDDSTSELETFLGRDLSHWRWQDC